MQVLCMATSDEPGDVQCPCCNQRYLVYYSRPAKAECEEALNAVLIALLDHHTGNPLPSAHPADAFNIPAWNGPVHASAAALLSGAPVRRPARARSVPIALVPPTQQRRVS